MPLIIPQTPRPLAGDRVRELTDRGFPNGYPLPTARLLPTEDPTPGGPAGVPSQTPSGGYPVDPLEIARRLARQRRLASDTDLLSQQTERDLGYSQVVADRNKQERTRKFTRGFRTLADPFLSSGLGNSGITNRGYTDYRVDYATDISNIELELQRQRGQLISARDKALRELALALGLDEEDLALLGADATSKLPQRIVPPGGLTA